MDPQQYKTTKTRRGYTYSYYLSKSAEESKPFILFLHGFPSTSQDWAGQVSYFANKGYNIIAPDLLGYGKTSHPEDAKEYQLVDIAEDVIDILNNENVEKVILIGHDWGSMLSSRIVNLFPERLSAVAFLAVGYSPPQADYDYEKYMALTKGMVGYELFGYWEYFSSKDSAKKCEENIDSFYSLLFPADPTIWKTDLGPRGKIREWVENNKQGPLASYLSHEEKESHKKALLEGGLLGPCNWYAAKAGGLSNEAEARIPQERYAFSIPSFYGAALQDYICIAGINKMLMPRFASNLTIEDFNTSHWIMFEAGDQLNTALDKFITGLKQ
ncbi:Alpha/Beta hydrolase protein [Crucibulum laeve]|uniref:Alpha/Beta hydrolase protein n=1 Tax=Crucibulum laeve TaxID=68775 RepID=A0A5C3M4S1_9AGAR|nr:Alpha/Beta hydrolase protein [Crucibulum laeve]